MTICILGRQPELGLAELESLFGTEKVRRVSADVAEVSLDHSEIPHKRLGGTVKTAKLLTELDTVEWNKLIGYCKKTLPQHLGYIPDGKIKLGISCYGFTVSPQKIGASALTLKKAIREQGRSVRVVPNTEAALSSAQTLHNQLTGPLGMELIFVKYGNKTLLGQVVWVQDINDYTRRDRERPKRDARVGMLPPKLAQIMINLAGKHVLPPDATIDPEHPMNKNPRSSRLLDPFCGTGVILQEAALMGYAVYGTDINERMIRYSRDNLNWLQDTYQTVFDWYLHEADATTAKWQQPFDLVACETYLGKPLLSIPPPEELADIIAECNIIARDFLKNLASQAPSGSRHCIAIPAWHVNDKVHHLPMLDDLAGIGYNRISFEHAPTTLLYRRPDQIVGRELLVLTRQ